MNPFLAKKAAEFSLAAMLELADAYYASVVQPLMYNYIRDHSLFRRNAAIALGNLGDPEAVPALARALADEAEVVRAHAAWALGRIGGAAARQALLERHGHEPGELARAEIEEAIG